MAYDPYLDKTLSPYSIKQMILYQNLADVAKLEEVWEIFHLAEAKGVGWKYHMNQEEGLLEILSEEGESLHTLSMPDLEKEVPQKEVTWIPYAPSGIALFEYKKRRFNGTIPPDKVGDPIQKLEGVSIVQERVIPPYWIYPFTTPDPLSSGPYDLYFSSSYVGVGNRGKGVLHLFDLSGLEFLHTITVREAPSKRGLGVSFFF